MLLAFAYLIDYCRFFLRKASISHDALLWRSNTNNIRKEQAIALVVCCLPIAISYDFGLKRFDLQLRIPPPQFLFRKKIGKVDSRAWITDTSVPVETTHHTVEFYFLGGKQISSIYFALFVFVCFFYSSRTKKMAVRDPRWLTTTTTLIPRRIDIFSLTRLTTFLLWYYMYKIEEQKF